MKLDGTDLEPELELDLEQELDGETVNNFLPKEIYADIYKYTRLRGEELDLFLEKQVIEFNGGVKEAFDRIFEHYYPILERLSHRQRNEDIIQELSMTLLKAMQTFQSDKGAKFNTYFWKCAQNQLGCINVYNKAKKRTAENGTVSMQQTYSMEKTADTQLETFIEDNDAKMFQDDSAFQISLRFEIYPLLRNDEIIACEMIQAGYGLKTIGEKLGGISAPAVHIKLRRLEKKKHIGSKLRELYNM